MNTFHLTIATPQGKKFDSPALRLDVKGTEGALAIMAGHVAFATTLVPSNVTILLENGTKKTAVSGGGLLSVKNNSAVLTSVVFEFD